MSRILADVLKQFLGDYHDHNEDTGQMSFDCPACAEYDNKGQGRHKLAVNYKKNIFRCWVCGFEHNMHGKVQKLIKRYGNKRILKEYDLLRPRNEYDTQKKSVQVEVKLPKGFKPLSDCSGYEFKYHNAYGYLTKRGITDEMIKDYNIGYTVVGKYHDRVIIPSYDEFGDLNYFISRSWSNWNQPKYLNPTVDKHELIFNENRVNWDATIYLVEGVFDHLVVPNSIPLLGKHLPEKLRMMLHSKAKSDIIILLDEDAMDNAMKIYRQLNSGELYNRIKLCVPSYGNDPSSIFEKSGIKGVVDLLRTSAQIPESRLY